MKDHAQFVKIVKEKGKSEEQNKLNKEKRKSSTCWKNRKHISLLQNMQKMKKTKRKKKH